MPSATVLFIDSDTRILNALRRQLRRQPWHMHFVDNAAEGLATIDRRGVDVVVTELRLADMGGLAVLDWLQEHHPRIGRVVLSGFMDEALIERAERRVDRLLYKPWLGNELVEALRQAFTVRMLSSAA